MIQTLADAAYESLLLLLEAVLPSTWSRALLPRQDHFPPHDRINFEGYYTRIHCDNDDSLIIITSSVPTARPEGLPYFVHCSYAPSVVATGGHHSHQTAAFRADAFPESMTVSKQPPFADNGVVPFKLDFGETGFYQVGDRQQSYHLSFSDGTEVDVDIAQRTPLFDEDPLKAPHGMFARLVHILPLQCVFALATREDGNAMRVAQVDTSLYIHTSWEIFSPKGRATYKISKSGKVLVQGEGTAHIEKNWGVSFPAGWTWSQGYAPDKSVSYALAGGRILGNKAMMLVLKTPTFTWSFKPLWTIRALGLSLGFAEEYDNKSGRLKVTVNDATRKVVVNVKSDQPLDQWTYLHCPMATGHNNTTAWETFQAGARVETFQRTWLLGFWRLHNVYEMPTSCCLEFGGSYSSLESKKSV